MAYADYAFYTTEYFGTSIQEPDFPRLAERASAFLDYYTQGRAENNADMREVKMACCAVAERQQVIENAQAVAMAGMEASMSSGGREVQTESVGSWSRTYSSNDGGGWSAAWAASEDMQAALAQAARMYLAHTGLLYRGGLLCSRTL